MPHAMLNLVNVLKTELYERQVVRHDEWSADLAQDILSTLRLPESTIPANDQYVGYFNEDKQQGD